MGPETVKFLKAVSCIRVENQRFHSRTFPSRWQKWDFKTRHVRLQGHDLCLLSSAPAAAEAWSRWMGLAEHTFWAVFLKWWMHVCGWNSPCWAQTYCTSVLSFSQLWTRLLFLLLLHVPRSLCQPCSRLGMSISFSSCFSLYWEAVFLASTLCHPDALTERFEDKVWWLV